MSFFSSTHAGYPVTKISAWFLTLVGVHEIVSGYIQYLLPMTVQAPSRASISGRASAHDRTLRMVWRVADPDRTSAVGDRTALPNARAFGTSLGDPCPRPDDLRCMVRKGVEQSTSPARTLREPGYGRACNGVLAFVASFFAGGVPSLNPEYQMSITGRKPSWAFGACP